MHPDPSSARPLSRRALLRNAALGTAAVAGVAGGLTGCSDSSSTGTTTITFYESKPEVIGYFDAVIERFHRSQSKIRVVHDSTSNLSADFVRANPPDLGCLNYNFSTVAFVEHGAFSDLSDLPEAQRINPDLLPLIAQTASYPGRTSVLPYSVMSASVIYDKALFAKHSVDVPTTWTQLIEICDKLAHAGVTPFYSTYKDNWTIAQGMFDYSIGGMTDVGGFFEDLAAEGDTVGPASATSFSKDWQAPMQRMLKLASYSNKDAASRGYGDGNLAFAQQKAAMYLQGPWALNEIAKTSPHLELGTFPLPVTDDPADLKVRVNVDLALWIPESSPKQDAAREFLSFLMQPEIIDRYNADNNGFGSTTDAPPTKNPALVGMQKYYDQAAFYLGPSQLVPSSIPVANYAQAMVLGADPVATLSKLDQDWNRLAVRSA